LAKRILLVSVSIYATATSLAWHLVFLAAREADEQGTETGT